jgi:hypothetical protein
MGIAETWDTVRLGVQPPEVLAQAVHAAARAQSPECGWARAWRCYAWLQKPTGLETSWLCDTLLREGQWELALVEAMRASWEVPAAVDAPPPRHTRWSVASQIAADCGDAAQVVAIAKATLKADAPATATLAVALRCASACKTTKDGRLAMAMLRHSVAVSRAALAQHRALADVDRACEQSGLIPVTQAPLNLARRYGLPPDFKPTIGLEELAYRALAAMRHVPTMWAEGIATFRFACELRRRQYGIRRDRGDRDNRVASAVAASAHPLQLATPALLVHLFALVADAEVAALPGTSHLTAGLFRSLLRFHSLEATAGAFDSVAAAMLASSRVQGPELTLELARKMGPDSVATWAAAMKLAEPTWQSYDRWRLLFRFATKSQPRDDPKCAVPSLNDLGESALPAAAMESGGSRPWLDTVLADASKGKWRHAIFMLRRHAASALPVTVLERVAGGLIGAHSNVPPSVQRSVAVQLLAPQVQGFVAEGVCPAVAVGIAGCLLRHGEWEASLQMLPETEGVPRMSDASLAAARELVVMNVLHLVRAGQGSPLPLQAWAVENNLLRWEDSLRVLSASLEEPAS